MLRSALIASVVATAFVSVAAADPYAERRRRMVDEQIAARGIADETVLDVLRTVPRHRFVPDALLGNAYDDRPLPIGYGQTISQPFIVAIMTELLEAEPGYRVLEVGAGSGYQAAVLAEIVEEIVTVEIIPELAERARRTMAELGYDNATVIAADGYFGWEERAPYDAIIVTAAAAHIPPPLVEQLKPGGRMVIPVGPPMQVQHLILLEKDAGGEVSQRVLMPVRFVPLTGGR